MELEKRMQSDIECENTAWSWSFVDEREGWGRGRTGWGGRRGG